VREEFCHLGLGHIVRVPLIVKEDKPSNPVEILLLSPKTIMLAPDYIADLIRQFGLAR